MTNWNYNPNEYSARNFEPIPAGDYRVKIKDVKEKVFSTGKEGFEITLDVPGYSSKLWYYLVIDPSDSLKTNQRIGMFFDSFAIRDTNLNHYSNWIGCDGAVRVKQDIYNGTVTSRVVFCLSRKQQKKFPDFGTRPVGQSSQPSISSSSIHSHQKQFSGFDTIPATPQGGSDGFHF